MFREGAHAFHMGQGSCIEPTRVIFVISKKKRSISKNKEFYMIHSSPENSKLSSDVIYTKNIMDFGFPHFKKLERILTANYFNILL